MTDWTQVAAIATASAALLTGGSLVLIGWQARETRRTAGAAVEGLSLNRDSLAVSQTLAAESIKMRLDARAPRLLVAAAPTNSESARHKSEVTFGGIGNPWPPEREFRRTEDDYQYLTLGAQFEITNEGVSSVVIWLDGAVNLLRPSAPPASFSHGRFTVSLEPGGKCEFRVEQNRPLHEWADAWLAREQGNPESGVVIGHATCSDAYDEGVIDRWELRAYCLPVQPKPNDLAGWTLRRGDTDPPVVLAHVSRMRRTYYLSKENDRELDAN